MGAKLKYGLGVHDSAARRGPDGEWVVPLQAWIFRRNEERHRIRMAFCRKFLVEMFHGIKDIDETASRKYEERGRLIFRSLVFRGGEKGVLIEARFDGEAEWRKLPLTGNNGRVEVELTVSPETVRAAAVNGTLGITVRVIGVKAGSSELVAHGLAVLHEPEGVMVISDIDDTVKVTGVFIGEHEVVRNTFLKEFEAVKGMAELYTSWARDFSAAFCFVSNSPPELQEPLREFLISSGFPRSPIFLRPLGGSKEERKAFKLAKIKELLQWYPRRKVVLVGDSGEHDPAMCAELLRDHPDQVAKALIRQVAPDLPVPEEVIAGIPPRRFQVFEDPFDAELPQSIRPTADLSLPEFLLQPKVLRKEDGVRFL